MKLIFKIYKKVRELKREEKEVKENIERYKKEEEIKLKRQIEDERKVLYHNWTDFKDNLISRDKELYEKEAYIQGQIDLLDEREQEINDLHNQLNEREKEAQIELKLLKLGPH